MRYLVETFGCQMNVHDSERIAGLLDRAGHVPADDEEEAELVVLNTCSVREHAADKLFSRLGELRTATGRDGHRPLLAVAGCVAQQEGERLLQRVPFVDLVLGTQAVRRLPELLEEVERSGRRQVDVRAYEDPSFPLGIARRADPVRAYVTILEGCNDFCSFCVVPYTRGHERMRRKSEILDEVSEAVAGGRSEIHLLGQIVNHYQAPDDPACDFPGLLEAVDAVPGVQRIRFASPHPRHTGDRLIEALRDLPHVCKHLHLPVQSGSSRVLAAMRRRHTRDEYLDLIAKLRTAIPSIAISTDMIVGFPGETADDFEETLSLVRAVRFHAMFSFKYSERPNTLASKRLADDVPEDEKGSRLWVLQQEQRGIQLAIHQAMVGSEVEVLVDSPSRRNPDEVSGRTTGNVVVNVAAPASSIGKLGRARVTAAGPNSVRGVLVGPESLVVRDRRG